MSTIHIDAAAFYPLFITFCGILLAVGGLLRKQKNQCDSIKTINRAVWDEKGRPILQSIEGCDKERQIFKELCKQIMTKLNDMDKKRDGAVIYRNKQIRKIELHMLKIELWYEETHGKSPVKLTEKSLTEDH